MIRTFSRNGSQVLTAELVQAKQARQWLAKYAAGGDHYADDQWLVRWINGHKHDGFHAVASAEDGIEMLRREGYQETTKEPDIFVCTSRQAGAAAVSQTYFCAVCVHRAEYAMLRPGESRRIRKVRSKKERRAVLAITSRCRDCGRPFGETEQIRGIVKEVWRAPYMSTPLVSLLCVPCMEHRQSGELLESMELTRTFERIKPVDYRPDLLKQECSLCYRTLAEVQEIY